MKFQTLLASFSKQILSNAFGFHNWNAGRILSESPYKWYLNLRYLVLDGGLRNNLACAGKEDARARKKGQLACLWLDAIVQAANMDISTMQKVEKV